MPPESPIAAFDFVSGPLRGTHLALYATRLLHQGQGTMESISLTAIAAVSVSYVRHEQRMGGGVALALLGVVLFAAGGPLGSFAAGAAAEVTGAQSVAELLRGVLRALEAFAVVLPVAGVAGVAGGAALVAFGWIGSTTLSLLLPAAERAYEVRGQNRLLVDFADLLAERVAQRSH